MSRQWFNETSGALPEHIYRHGRSNQRNHPTEVAYVKHTSTWPELAIGLYEALTEKKAEITYHFEDMKVEIPSGTGPEAQHALWKLDGKLRISTKTTE